MKLHRTKAVFLAITLFAGSGLAKERPQAGVETSKKSEVNAGVIGLAGGQLEGAPIRLAAEIARVVDDGNRLHVLPIVTRGPSENIESLLYLRGVDAAITNADVLDQFKDRAPRGRINYLLNLFPSEVQILARPGIDKLEDLKGHKVNFNTAGTAAAYSGPLIFNRLGLDVTQTFIPHQTALEMMKAGEMDAVFFITSKPVDAFLKGRFPAGFKLLSVPYDERVADYYQPASLDHSDYPTLVPEGQVITTIAVPTILIAFNWASGSERYHRLARLIDRLFANVDKLQGPGFDAKWKSLNLAAQVPSLERFRPAQDWLDRAALAEAKAGADPSRALSGVDLEAARQQIARVTGAGPAEQTRLLAEFLRWRQQQSARDQPQNLTPSASNRP